MKKYKCRFESEGVEALFDNGMMCESISFYRPCEPALREERLKYAASMLNALIDRGDMTMNLEVFRWLESVNVAHYDLSDMLECILDGECYKSVVRASGLRVSMSEIFIGLQIYREDDVAHYAFSYLTIPLEDTGGRVVFRDSENSEDRVTITWENGIVQKVS